METINRSAAVAQRCPLHQTCGRFLRTLSQFHIDTDGNKLDADEFAMCYLQPEHDHCYCGQCDPRLPDTLPNIGGTDYELPKGWCGFGLKLGGRAVALKIWDKWPVTYHGCKAANVPSVLREGSLLLPGDKLMDGTKLRNAHTGGGDGRIHIYTSPSVLYSELDIYTEPVAFEGHNVRVVLQCRQNPAALSTCGETIGWAAKFGDVSISPHVENDKIECFTDSRAAVIPYRVLIKLNSDTREYQEWRIKTFDSLEQGLFCRVVADASIVCASGNHAPEHLLGRVGKVVHVSDSEVRLKFQGGKGNAAGGQSQEATHEKGLGESAKHCKPACVGQEVRVVSALKRAKNACKKCTFTPAMANYLGMCGTVVEKASDRLQLEFEDGNKYWWGLDALESLPRPSGNALRNALRGGGAVAGAAAGTDAVVWEFREGGAWKAFDSAAATAAEAALQASEPVAQSLFKNARTGKETRYTYDLARMLQTNTTTSFERKIRRTPPPPAPTWQFEEHKKWQSFDGRAAAAAEAALQASPPVRVVRSDFVHTKTKKPTAYEFDLMERLQTNTETGYKRKIRRNPPYDVSVFPDDDDAAAADDDDDDDNDAPPAGDKSACSLCCEDGRVSTQDAAEKITDNCGHERTVCNECLARHVEAEVRSKGNFTTIKCPQSGCGAEMEHHKVQQWAIASVFETYDQLKLRAFLQKNDEFRWCSHPTCGYGQLHPGKDTFPIMSCFKCKRKTCFTHSCQWHENRTCTQYDQDAAACEEVALLQALQKGAGIKQCPKCGQGIQKSDGCDHMTCKKPAGCGFEFCWRCEAPYDGSSGIRQVGNKAHKPSCLYHM